jgi:hypothetical protein
MLGRIALGPHWIHAEAEPLNKNLIRLRNRGDDILFPRGHDV